MFKICSNWLRLGLTNNDLGALLARFNQSTNLGVGNLGRLLAAAEEEAAQHRFDRTTCVHPRRGRGDLRPRNAGRACGSAHCDPPGSASATEAPGASCLGPGGRREGQRSGRLGGNQAAADRSGLGGAGRSLEDSSRVALSVLDQPTRASSQPRGCWRGARVQSEAFPGSWARPDKSAGPPAARPSPRTGRSAGSRYARPASAPRRRPG